MYKCPICPKRYKRRKAFVDHLKEEGFSMMEIKQILEEQEGIEEKPKKPNKPKIMKDEREEYEEAECPECGALIKVKYGQKKIKCPECGERLVVEW